MANWLDVVALLVTLAVAGAVAYGVSRAGGLLRARVQSTKAALKERGLDVSGRGVAVTTAGRLDREAYVDATQRGFVKAMGASSFRKSDGSASKPVMQPLQASSSSDDKKRGMFGLRKARAE